LVAASPFERWVRAARAGWLSVEELELQDGEWQLRRRVNGDEADAGEWIRLPALQQTQSETFPIRQNKRLSGILALDPPTAGELAPDLIEPNSLHACPSLPAHPPHRDARDS